MTSSLFWDVTQRKLDLNARCVTSQNSADLFYTATEA